MAPGWGFDTDDRISSELAAKIAATPMPNGQAVSFVFRYLSRHQPFAASDITNDEAKWIVNSGLTLLLVQHAQYPGLPIDGDNGTALGQTAAAHARAVNYPAGGHLVFDLEGVSDSGQPVIECLRNWAAEVHAAGFKVIVYIGYSTGLTPAQLSKLDFIDGWWCDFAQRVPPDQGFLCHQCPQVDYLGFPIDPDHAYPDKLGRCLMGMTADPIDPRLLPDNPVGDGLVNPATGDPY